MSIFSRSVTIRTADLDDISTCKTIADQNRSSIGFLPRAVFADAVGKGQLLVACVDDATVVGFIRFNHRLRGTSTALYDLCVDCQFRLQGVGKALVAALAAECRKLGRSEIVLRCPSELSANQFYSALGFVQLTIEPGKRRPVVVWKLEVGDKTCNS